MVDISFEIGGVIVEFNNAKNALEKALFQGVREYVKHAVGLFVVLSMEQRQKSSARGPVWAIRTLKYQDVVKSLQILYRRSLSANTS